ncbi:efflux RND transporter periplasmic adaptor subunit [Jannaschia seohaensis]|uniref:RND family efflux transporter MFP subunit n=1 Tax=Jannaschia seohaensis TaxID=475081 RepID=A0A2Y9ALP5_9RHOB|nr:efflux RND transporter periplasmic adaptor subunit [Jannaschia seohaensis]PWJ20244.1 RND family efflux transporter MFP subunit [Jannaschia seohaensis]SSA44248.1 RND family efflux transporter, MFP subunit [Jannaschia seohaensis]
MRAALPLFLALAATPAPAQDWHECLIAPRATVRVASAVSGVVDEVLVAPGDYVEEGQVLARLRSAVERANADIAAERAAYEAGLELGEVRLDLARRNLARLSELSRSNIASRAALEEAEAEARSAEIELDRAEFERRLAELEQARAAAILDQRVVRAPISGVVVERLLWPGEVAGDQAQVVTLAQLDPLEVRTFVPSSLWGSIAPGQEARVRPDAPVGGERAATVVSVDQVFDAASGTMGVRLQLPNPDQGLPAGLACRVAFDGAAPNEEGQDQ